MLEERSDDGDICEGRGEGEGEGDVDDGEEEFECVSKGGEEDDDEGVKGEGVDGGVVGVFWEWSLGVVGDIYFLGKGCLNFVEDLGKGE